MKTLWNTVIAYPFINALLLLYGVFGHNLGLAVIILTIILRLLLIPTSKAQYHSSKKMAALKPKLEALQKKYANDKEELAKQQMKLYRSENYNPLGCFFSIVPQLVIFIGLFQVIKVVTDSNLSGMYPFIQNMVFGGEVTPHINTWFWGLDLSSNFKAVAQQYGYISVNVIPYILLAVSVAGVQMLSTKFMQAMQGLSQTKKTQPRKKEQLDGEPLDPEMLQKMMSQMMVYTFPILTGIMALTMPSILGLYWITQSFMLIVQYIFIDKKTFMKNIKVLFKVAK